MTQQSVAVILVQIECRIPMAHSLKQKRAVIKSAIERLRNRFNASVVESAFQDKWQRSLISLCAVSGDRSVLQSLPDKVRLTLDELPELQVCDLQLMWL